MVRAMIVLLLLGSLVLGWLIFQQRSEIDRLEAALLPGGEVEKTIQKIQSKGYLYTQYNNRKLEEGVRGDADQDSIASYVRRTAQDNSVLWGNVTIGKADRDLVTMGGKKYSDTGYRVEPKEKSQTFGRNRIANFLYLLELRSRKLKVTEVDISLAEKADDHEVPKDLWDVEFKVTVRERVADS